MKKTLILLLLTISVLFTSCFEDNDDNIREASTSEINDFIYRGLNFFYVYKSDRAELANDFFANEGEYNDFLSSFSTPETFFDYLKAPQDRFSILVPDFVELENALSGTTFNTGMEYGLLFYPDGSENIFGYVRYVLPNSDAAAKGVERGMIFNRVDGQQLTETNFSDLLAPLGFTISLATFDGTDVFSTNESIELRKEEFTENPIQVAKTLDVNGQKIGYLMYNAFTNEFDSQLNSAFAQFQSDGVSDLVIDLRYNGGGSVRTAIYLAGMITGQNSGEIFYTEEWNEDRQEEYAENGLFVNSFINGGEAINSLNLSKVYVLTSSRTASASELVINGLNPYIDVVQVGTNTTGKYQASFLLYDAPAPGFSRNQANLDHTYAMLPLVFQTANANGFTGFDNGLVPDIELPEDYTNLGVLGEETEPLLAAAIADITGIPAPQPRQAITVLETVSESKASLPNYQLMILDRE